MQVCWSPDGKYLATGGEDDFLTLFSFDSEEHSARVLCRGHGHTSWISAISFDPYMNAKTYYSSLVQRPSSSSLNKDEENYNDQIQNSIAYSRSSSSCFDNNIPSIFYRIASVGQDNRLCFWDITEDILKINKIHLTTKKNSSSNYPLISSPLNGYSSFLSNTTQLISTNPSVSTTKSSFSSITSRLSFVRNSNKIHKSLDDTSESSLTTLSNGSTKKHRKLPSLSHTFSGSKSSPSSTTSNDSAQGSLSTLTNNSSSSRRTNFDLTKTIFGTSLCPRLDDIQVIEPIVAELISQERLNGIYFGENSLLTSSQDGIITIWEKPQIILPTNSVCRKNFRINSFNSFFSLD